MGDQIFTDCIAAHRAGIRFALVKPIKDKETLFFRIKRFFERPFVKKLKWKTKEKKPRKIGKKRFTFKLKFKKTKETETNV